ncbi:MAG: hypothetical protein HYS27_17440 [Deltaproteobacteria bacterium]|nr:hypothetical protein [Deltaproteobacteria bacterium]
MVPILALLIAAAAPRPAPADGARLLVVPEPNTDAARVDELYDGLRAAGLSLVGLDERAGVDRPAGEPSAPGVRDDARARIASARARFYELELETAKGEIDAALDELVRLERPEDALELFEEALLVRATIVSAGGGDVDRDLALLAHLVPAREALNPAVHAPSLVDAYARVRAAALAAKPGTLRVRPRVANLSPPQVLVDGRPPAADLVQGPHLVLARAQGTEPFARLVDLGEEPLMLEPFLAPRGAGALRAAAVQRARDAKTELERTGALAELAALCAARGVVLVSASGAELWVRDPPEGRPQLSPLAVSAGADGAAVGTATLAALQAPAKERLGLPSEDGPPPAVVWAASAGGVTTGVSLLALGLWALWPADLPPNEAQPTPTRPVAFGCCVD